MPNVNLGSHFERFVQDKLAEGRFQNASEVIRAGLRLLEDSEAGQQERRAAIRAEIAERIGDAQPTVPAERVFAELRAHHGVQVKAGRRGA